VTWRSRKSAGTSVARRARTKAEQRAETSEQILDAAEYLFSKRGLYGVSLRDVAKRVTIHESLVKYYFKDKTNLFEAVTARRASVTSGRRMRALEEYEHKAGDKPTVEGALRAFLDTDLASRRSRTRRSSRRLSQFPRLVFW
jgi:AcrR family transcriptional regulator